VVAALLAAGADPDRPGPGGEPPLVAAARRGSPGCVRALLAAGAGARDEALAEARRWAAADVAAELRAGLEAAYGAGPGYRVRRFVAEKGAPTVEVTLVRDGRVIAGDDRQLGHAAIVTELLGRAGRGV
jgi:hypothetical protein